MCEAIPKIGHIRSHWGNLSQFYRAVIYNYFILIAENLGNVGSLKHKIKNICSAPLTRVYHF